MYPIYPIYVILSQNCLKWGPFYETAKLVVHNFNFTMVYGTCHEILPGRYKPTNIKLTETPHCWSFPRTELVVDAFDDWQALEQQLQKQFLDLDKA